MLQIYRPGAEPSDSAV